MCLPLFHRFLFVCHTLIFFFLFAHILHQFKYTEFKHAFGFIFISALNGVVDCIKIVILDWIF